MTLDESVARDRQSKPWRAFLRDNPGIAPSVETYLDGGARPSTASLEPNHYAVARVLAEDARRTTPPENPSAELCLPRAQRDFGVPTSGDAQPKFQAMLDSLGDGKAVAVEIGNYTFNNPVRVNPDSMRIVGLGGQNKFGGGGTCIRPGRDNMTLFEDGFTQNVKHLGTTFEWINIDSSRAGARGFDFLNCNTWRVLYCASAGRFARGAIHTDIPDDNPAGDNAYSEVVAFQARLTEGIGLHVREGGTMNVRGGYFDAPGGIVIERAAQVHMINGKSNNPGRLLYCAGQLNTIEWDFEQYDSTNPFVYAVEIMRDPNMNVPWSGAENRIASIFVDHPHGSGKMLHLGPGTRNNIVDSFWQGGIGGGSGGSGQYYWDEGSGNQNRNPK
jgi:hypothetical protein